jgi:CRISPR-associated protein Csd1
LAKLATLKKGRAVEFDKRIGEIIDFVNNFPRHLDLYGQGEFAIGYYHQRQDFFTKKTKEADNG